MSTIEDEVSSQQGHRGPLRHALIFVIAFVVIANELSFSSLGRWTLELVYGDAIPSGMLTWAWIPGGLATCLVFALLLVPYCHWTGESYREHLKHLAIVLLVGGGVGFTMELLL